MRLAALVTAPLRFFKKREAGVSRGTYRSDRLAAAPAPKMCYYNCCTQPAIFEHALHPSRDGEPTRILAACIEHAPLIDADLRAWMRTLAPTEEVPSHTVFSAKFSAKK